MRYIVLQILELADRGYIHPLTVMLSLMWVERLKKLSYTWWKVRPENLGIMIYGSKHYMDDNNDITIRISKYGNVGFVVNNMGVLSETQGEEELQHWIEYVAKN